MSLSLTSRYLPITALLLSIGACSSSDSDNTTITENEPSSTEEVPPNDSSEPVDGENPTPLLPPVTAGSDLERLIQGMTSQASLTLLDLNRRISQGEELTSQQEACLGTYEDGFGKPLTTIDCGELPLATADIPLGVGQAAFYETPTCLASLFNQSSEGCILKHLSLTIRTEWGINTNGRPIPIFPGAELAYAIGDSSLRIDNDSLGLTGEFSCVINLETASLTSNATNCGNAVEQMADQIETLQK